MGINFPGAPAINPEVKISFWGATGTVTGSKYLIEAGDLRILVDCGLYQGEKELRLRNRETLPFKAESVDMVILTHAHIDHSGFLPALIKQGFNGPIYATDATFDLCKILLPDSGYLKEKYARYANKKKFSKHAPAIPLYTQQDAEDALEFFQAIPFHNPIDVANGVSFQFLRAGHILGASIVSLHIYGRHIVFSGDLGRPNSATMLPPEIPVDADYLIVESTYGDRKHNNEDPEIILDKILTKVSKRGGTVIIPGFAVGRTQLLLYHLWRLKSRGRLKNMPVFLDSPMAINASNIFVRHAEDHNFSKQECPEIFDVADYTNTVEQSKALSQSPYPKVILSASGMATGGRVLHHLRAYLEDSRNSVIFTGFQASGTRGEAITNGADHVRIFGEDIKVKAEIHNLDMLSAHADRDEILTWLKQFNRQPNNTFITHGEPLGSQGLASAITETLHWPNVIPTHGQSFILK